MVLCPPKYEKQPSVVVQAKSKGEKQITISDVLPQLGLIMQKCCFFFACEKTQKRKTIYNTAQWDPTGP